MSTTPFEDIVDRRGTGAIALDTARYGKPAGVLPLWVADMGFRTSPEVVAAIEARAAHGIYGYSEPTEAYHEAVAGWFARRHGWTIDPAWTTRSAGVVNALYLAVQGLTEPGEAVIVQPPVYPPFYAAVRNSGRQVLENPLVESDGRYQIDFDGFERLAGQASAFILCSPHNPVGRVWARAELERLAEICLRHKVLVISDEIHWDFVYAPSRHTVFATLSDDVANITLTCTSPSKTFNLAGLGLANIVARNPALLKAFRAAYTHAGLSQPSSFGLVAGEAAYRFGDDWVDALVSHVGGTMTWLASALQREVPAVRLIPPEGTYLAWLDCRGLGLAPVELNRFIEQAAGLWLNDGPSFGPPGTGFQRLNAAYPRALIGEAVDRLRDAVAAGR